MGELRRIVVDLTPVLPGGENGGSKVMTLELVRQLAQLAPGCEFVLLTKARNHEELAALEAPNVTCVRVDAPGPALGQSRSRVIQVRQGLKKVLPRRLVEWLSLKYQKWLHQLLFKDRLVRTLRADLLFCPFTAPTFYDASVPLISIVYDLQHSYYPEFFNPAEVERRDHGFREACRLAKYVVCISEYVRKTVLENADVPAERVKAIPILLAHRIRKPEEMALGTTLSSFGLLRGRFLLYPANFWRHKNHETLLEAFRSYMAISSGSDLKLVLTGAPGRRRDRIEEICRRDPVLCGRVVLPGYLAEQEFSALLYGCGAIIFPSLFEGFGMPLLEGMAAGKPLLVGNVTSLPEVAGEAALYFDPTVPSEIAEAVARLESDPGLRRDLATKAIGHVRQLGGPEEMAAKYLKIFHAAIG